MCVCLILWHDIFIVGFEGEKKGEKESESEREKVKATQRERVCVENVRVCV